MTGILITGGDKPGAEKLEELLESDTVLAAADSGIQWAIENGFSPDYYTGDMDSLESIKILDGIAPDRIFRVLPEKDETDTEIGIQILRKAGCGKILIWGGGGGRMDHFLAISALFDRQECPDEWYTAHEHFMVIKDRIEILGKTGKRVSVFPLGTKTCRMMSEGLKWPLERLRWRKGDFGISNIIIREKMIIQVKKGRLLLMLDWEEADRP